MTPAHTSLLQPVATTPAFASAVIALLCRRLREADFQLEGVALHRIEVRVARDGRRLARLEFVDVPRAELLQFAASVNLRPSSSR
jgi:CRP-like cAMP-binding protein